MHFIKRFSSCPLQRHHISLLPAAMLCLAGPPSCQAQGEAQLSAVLPDINTPSFTAAKAERLLWPPWS